MLRAILKEEMIMHLEPVKQEIADLKSEVGLLREQVQQVLVTVDEVAGSVDRMHGEYGAIVIELDRHNRWFSELSREVGLELAV